MAEYTLDIPLGIAQHNHGAAENHGADDTCADYVRTHNSILHSALHQVVSVALRNCYIIRSNGQTTSIKPQTISRSSLSSQSL